MNNAVNEVITKILNLNKTGAKRGYGYYNHNKKWLTGLTKEDVNLLIKETGKDPERLRNLLQQDPRFHEAIKKQTDILTKSYMDGILGTNIKFISKEKAMQCAAERKRQRQEKKEKEKQRIAEVRRRCAILNAKKREKEQAKRRQQKLAEKKLITELGLSPAKLKLAKLLFKQK